MPLFDNKQFLSHIY